MTSVYNHSFCKTILTLLLLNKWLFISAFNPAIFLNELQTSWYILRGLSGWTVYSKTLSRGDKHALNMLTRSRAWQFGDCLLPHIKMNCKNCLASKKLRIWKSKNKLLFSQSTFGFDCTSTRKLRHSELADSSNSSV